MNRAPFHTRPSRSAGNRDIPHGRPRRGVGRRTRLAALALLAACSGPAGSPLPNLDAEALRFDCAVTRSSETGSLDLADRVVALDGFDPVKIGSPINWAIDPFGHPSWTFGLHSLTWLLPYLADATTRAQAREIIMEWVNANPWDNPPSPQSWSDHSTALRAGVLACAIVSLGPESWLVAAAERHAEVLANPEFYRGEGNHALDQDIGLHRVGCVLGRLEWMELAERRATALAVESIDDEGVTNEGSVGYQVYNFRRYGVLLGQLEICERPIPAGLLRQTRMPVMMAHATRPDGFYEQLGDVPLMRAVSVPETPAEYAATGGASGPRPDTNVAIFHAGYVFGRSGWGEDRPFDQENFYSIRFGPGDVFRFHGHADHTSVTWHPEGVPVLIDSGFNGHANSTYRWSYIKGQAGHNLVMDRAADFLPDQGTSLEHFLLRSDLEAFHLVGTPHQGVQRERQIYVRHNPPILIVRDDLTSSRGVRTYDQLWHFHEDLAVSVAGPRAHAVGPNVSVHLIQLAAGAQMAVRTGETDPWQGWVSYRAGDPTPAPTLVATERARTANFLTVLAAGQAVEAHYQAGQVFLTVDGVEVVVPVDAFPTA